MNGGDQDRSGRSRRIASGAGESRWLEAQRRRRQQLTRRGRGTLTALGGLCAVAGLGYLASSVVSDGKPKLAAVEAAPRPVRLPPSPPPELLGRLPVTRAALDLPLAEPTARPASPPAALADEVAGPPAPVRVGDKGADGRFYERVHLRHADPRIANPVRVEYTMEAELTRHVFRALRLGRVNLAHVILADPFTGRLLAYASTDVDHFPPTRSYPAASLVKVITAAAALEGAPETARLPCRFRGSPYRLTPSRVDPPNVGRTVSLARALATSNNQCFAQLAVHAVGSGPLMEAIARFGWLVPPGPAHAPGSADPGEDRYDVGRLGCGLAGCRITPLHAAQLASTLVGGELIAPRWIERIVDANGRELPLPALPAPRRVLTPELAEELRSMLVGTTKSGTARSAFRRRNGRPLLGPVSVAGKTGSLSGKNPTGRYEWFIGVAPADRPRIVVAVVLVNGHLWWRNASQIGAEVLRGVFCPGKKCSAEAAARWTTLPETTAALQRAAGSVLN